MSTLAPKTSFFCALENNLMPFSATTHLRHDLHVFDMQIVQKENAYVKAVLLVNDLQTLESKKWLLISARIDDKASICLFRGFYQASLQKENSLWQVSFIAIPEDAQAQNKKLLDQHQESAFFDPLLTPESKQDDVETILLTRDVAIYTHPVTHQKKLSSLFKGDYVHDLSADATDVSFQLTPPLSTLDVKVSAEWVQQCHGWVDLTRSIRRLFPNGTISTLTPQHFQHQWPTQGQHLGRSGYWVALSSLNTIGKPQPHFCSDTQKKNTPGKVVFEQAFDGKLVLGWHMKQKRKEVFCFTMQHAHQLPQSGHKGVLHLSVTRALSRLHTAPFWMPHIFYEEGEKVQHNNNVYVCIQAHQAAYDFEQKKDCWQLEEEDEKTFLGHRAPSFFLSNRGQKAAAVAMEMAAVQLAKHARSAIVTCRIPFFRYPALSTADEACIKSDKLPGGRVQGKIEHCVLHVCPQKNQATFQVEILCSIGHGLTQKEQAQEKSTYCSEDPYHYVVQEGGSHQTPSGIVYERYDDQGPSDDMKNLVSKRVGYNIFVKNNALQQKDLLRSQQRKKDLSTQHFGTRVSALLQNLTTHDCLQHVIQLKKPVVWSSPKHVQFVPTTVDSGK